MLKIGAIIKLDKVFTEKKSHSKIKIYQSNTSFAMIDIFKNLVNLAILNLYMNNLYAIWKRYSITL